MLSLTRSVLPSLAARRRCYATETLHYDVCVIGGGFGGFSAASRAADYKKRVCLVNKGRLGGTLLCSIRLSCTIYPTLPKRILVLSNSLHHLPSASIHDGALSSKTMWEMSMDYKIASSVRRGYIARDLELSFDKVKKLVFKAQSIKEDQLAFQLQKLGIPVHHGFASFTDPNTISVAYENGDSQTIRADHFVIATGSSPRKHRTIAVNGVNIHDSDSLMNIESFPTSMVVLGAGVVGCEYATIFANYGQTKLFLIDKADRILPFEDYDVSALIARRMIKSNVTIHQGAELVSMRSIDVPGNSKSSQMVEYVVKYPAQNNRTETIQVEQALLSIGREPNLKGMNLKAAGVEVNEKNGALVVNDGQTTASHIWGAGDVTADIALVNVAELEGRHVVDKMFGKSSEMLSYENLSTIMFLDPLVSGVGYGERILQQEKIEYKVASFDYSLVSSALAKGRPTGFIKIMVSNDDKMTLLGVRAAGLHAATIIGLVSYLIKTKANVSTLTNLLMGYPDVIEGLQECCRLLTGCSVHKPSVFTDQTKLTTVTYNEDGSPKFTSGVAPYAVVDRHDRPRGWPIHIEDDLAFDSHQRHSNMH